MSVVAAGRGNLLTIQPSPQHTPAESSIVRLKMPPLVDCQTDFNTMFAVLPAAGTLYISVQNSGNIQNQLQIGALGCCVNNGTTNLCGYSQNGIVVSGLQNTTLAVGANTTFYFNVGEPTTCRSTMSVGTVHAPC